jgi:hypothetical protein
MSIYSYDTGYVAEQLLPPQLRTTMRLAWLRTLLASVKSKYNDIFGVQSYTQGFSLANWSSVTNYAIGNRVKYGVSIYEALTANVGLDPEVNTTDWLLVEKDFVGAFERVKYNGQKMVLQYILNRYLNTTYATIPTIYITTNTIDTNGFYIGVDGASELGELGDNSNQNDFLGTSYTLNQYSFTVYVPVLLFATLGTNAANRENRVRNVVDKYKLAGTNYNVTTY